MDRTAYIIYETGSAHDGDYARLEAIIDAVGSLKYPRRGIKFHPISADTLALPDFAYFNIYKELEFSHEQWKSLINKASDAIGDVWIEMADASCAKVFVDNLKNIAGVKFQASMVDNMETISILQDIDLKHCVAIVNISGYDLDMALERVANVAALGFAEIVYQIGFQDYPTLPADLGLNKIAILKAAAPGSRISFADHIDSTNSFASQIPLVANAMGCDIIEKHCCLKRDETKFDRFSAFEPHEISNLQDSLQDLSQGFSTRFVRAREQNYLTTSLIKPILRDKHPAGRLISGQDVIFRRSSNQGLAFTEVLAQQRNRFIPSTDIAAGSSVTEDVWRKARVGAIVAARLKSTRFPRKATHQIAGLSSVERCLESCLLNKDLDTVILASSTHPQDAELENYTLNGLVPFRRGDPDDVIKRYIEVADEFGVDVIVRVTGDCPIISPEVTKILVQEHFARGADLTRARRETVGATPQIISTQALKKVIELKGSAPYSEYMNLYFENNPDIFKVQFVDLPEEYIRDYRLTLDVAEDVAMFEALYGELNKLKLEPNLENAIKILDDRPDIASKNMDVQIKYHTDQELIDTLKRETRITV